jgi:hypothetical protein
LAEQRKLRFAVGTFDTWSQLREALDDARVRGLVLDSFNCIALQRVFVGKTIMAPSQEQVTLEVLPFLDSAELIACTSLSEGKASFRCAHSEECPGILANLPACRLFRRCGQDGQDPPVDPSR